MILRDWFRQFAKVLFRRRPYDEIDPMIHPLVELMNSTGVVETIASCQGHALSGEEPYVCFRASEHIAASMERVVRMAYAMRTGSLNAGWHIEGLFNERFELIYLLRSSYYEDKANAVIGSIVAFWFRRRRLARNFEELGRLFRQALDDQRELNEPEIGPAGERDQSRCPIS